MIFAELRIVIIIIKNNLYIYFMRRYSPGQSESENSNNYYNGNSNINNQPEIEHPEVVPRANLRGAQLEGAHLYDRDIREADLRGADLQRADLYRADLRAAYLYEADLRGADLRADLRGANLQRADLREAHLEGADLQRADLYRADLRAAYLYDADLREANLQEAHLEGADLDGADLGGASLRGVYLERVDLRRVILTGVDLTYVDLTGVILDNRQRQQIATSDFLASFDRLGSLGRNLSADSRINNLPEIEHPEVVPRANLHRAQLENAHLRRRAIMLSHLEEANLHGADLRRADLRGAILTGADLREANLERADLRGAILTGAILTGAYLYGADLREANLERADLHGADLRRADLRRADLRGAILTGADLDGADLGSAFLRGVDLTRVDLTRVDLTGSILSNEQREQILASARQSVSAGPFDLTISRNFFRGKVINIPRKLRVGTKNSASNSCPSYKPLYDQLMLVDLDGAFQFSFEGQTGIGPGLTKMVYSFVLPVYTKLYFVKVPATEFIILKKDTNIKELHRHTQQMIKLAKAAQSQIYLQIDPRLLELLLPQNAAETIARSNNFHTLYANLKAKIAEAQKWGMNMSNYLLKKDQNQNLPIQSFGNINKLEREIKAEIILRKKLHDFGFQTWLQYQNMANFIKIFWIASNRRNEYPLFSCEIKYDIESFMERLKIKRVDNQQVLNIQEAQSLYGVYPALGPLLDYILDQSENGNENRRKLVKYVAGTEYTLDRILILLQTVEIPFEMSNKTKIYKLPFLAHTCSASLDLFRNPSVKNYQEVWTPARIDEEITKGSGLSAHN